MTKNKMGRPHKYNNRRNIIFEVLQSLPQDGSPIRFKDLRVQVKMSSATLSKALFYLCTIGVISKHDVPSHRGKGVEYQRASWNIFGDMEYQIKYVRENLIKQKADNEKPDIVSGYEFTQVIQLCYYLGYLNTIIIHALKHYADAENSQKDALLETHLYAINGMITKLLTKLVNEPLGMSDFTYIVSSRACEYQLKNIHNYLELVDKTIRLNENIDKQKLSNFLYEPSVSDFLKKIFPPNRE